MHKTILIMPINRETLHQMVRFGVVGVVATALHYGVYWLLHAVTDVNLAYTIGYAVSFVANYLLSARFTFRRKKTVANGLGFCAAHLLNYLLQLALLNLFIRLGVSPALAPVPVYCVAVPVNFIVVRTVFRRWGG